MIKLTMGNFISVPRTVFNEDAFPKEPFSRREAFLDLVQRATREQTSIPIKGGVVKIKRGELVVSIRTLSSRWGWSKSKVEKVINEFISWTLIGRRTDGVTTIISISNYDVFQKPVDTQKDAGKDGDKDTNKDNNNNINNNNKETIKKASNDAKESLSFPFSSEQFMSTWNILVKQPKWKPKPMSALQLSLKRLSKYDEEFAIMLMERSIENNWQGVVFDNTPGEYEEWKKAKQASTPRVWKDGIYWRKDFTDEEMREQFIFDLPLRQRLLRGGSVRRKDGIWVEP